MPWRPGQSGNPAGPKSDKPFRDALRMELAMAADGRLDPVPARSARAMVRAQIAKATEGDTNAFVVLVDRYEGKPKQVVVGDSEDDPIRLAHERGADARSRLANALNRLGGKLIEGAVVEDSTQHDCDTIEIPPRESMR